MITRSWSQGHTFLDLHLSLITLGFCLAIKPLYNHQLMTYDLHSTSDMFTKPTKWSKELRIIKN